MRRQAEPVALETPPHRFLLELGTEDPPRPLNRFR
jgi:hypothetical protein